jgi:hypothetical protein
MKVRCIPFLLLMVSYAAIMQETSYAASPQPASEKNHPHSRAGLNAANHPKQPPTGQKRPIPRNTARLRQSPLARSGAAKGGLIKNETTHHGLPPVRLTSVLPSVASLNPSLHPLPNDVRHRGPNAAVVSASANSRISNTGAVNGTGMHRRP